MFTAYRNVWFWFAVILVVPALWALWINYPMQMGGLHIVLGVAGIIFSTLDTTFHIDYYLIGDMDDGALKRNIKITFWMMFVSFMITCLIIAMIGLGMLIGGDIPIKFV